MTEKEFEEIISLKDRDGILTELKKHGFREAGVEGEREFDHEIISSESAYCKKIIVEDIPDGREYQGYMYKDNSKYEGKTFIIFNIYAVLRDFNRTIPRTTILLTDAPYDIEYELRAVSPYACDRCKKEYIKKKLYLFETELLCYECLSQVIEYERRKFRI